MTTIVAVQKDGVACLAADSQASTYWTAVADDVDKIMKLGKAYLAFTGACSSVQAFSHYVDNNATPELDDEGSLFELALGFHGALKEKYFFNAKSGDSIEPSELAFLAVTPGGIFSVGEERSIHKYSQFTSFGSGREFALGAAHCLYNYPLHPKDIAKRAVGAALKYDVYTGGKIRCVSVKLK